MVAAAAVSICVVVVSLSESNGITYINTYVQHTTYVRVHAHIVHCMYTRVQVCACTLVNIRIYRHIFSGVNAMRCPSVYVCVSMYARTCVCMLCVSKFMYVYIQVQS